MSGWWDLGRVHLLSPSSEGKRRKKLLTSRDFDSEGGQRPSLFSWQLYSQDLELYLDEWIIHSKKVG